MRVWAPAVHEAEPALATGFAVSFCYAGQRKKRQKAAEKASESGRISVGKRQKSVEKRVKMRIRASSANHVDRFFNR